jgi:hypothetical protein
MLPHKTDSKLIAKMVQILLCANFWGTLFEGRSLGRSRVNFFLSGAEVWAAEKLCGTAIKIYLQPTCYVDWCQMKHPFKLQVNNLI